MVQRRESTSSDAVESSAPAQLSTRQDVPSRQVDRKVDRGASTLDTARAVALAAAVEAMSSGHARILAAELRALLEATAGPGADVIPMRGREPKR